MDHRLSKLVHLTVSTGSPLVFTIARSAPPSDDIHPDEPPLFHIVNLIGHPVVAGLLILILLFAMVTLNYLWSEPEKFPLATTFAEPPELQEDLVLDGQIADYECDECGHPALGTDTVCRGCGEPFEKSDHDETPV